MVRKPASHEHAMNGGRRMQPAAGGASEDEITDGAQEAEAVDVRAAQRGEVKGEEAARSKAVMHGAPLRTKGTSERSRDSKGTQASFEPSLPCS